MRSREAAPRAGRLPARREDLARAFYADGLGLTEVAKPEALRARGGAWFRAHADDTVTAELHVGVEDPFRPATRAHPALLLDDVAELDRTADRLAASGHEVDHTERHTFDGFVRVHVRDPHGNRVELLASTDGQVTDR